MADGEGPKFTLVVTVAGRKALPARAIPFVTGWSLSPDIVAKQLAKREDGAFAGLRRTHAHVSDGSPFQRQVLPKEWDLIVAKLSGLESELKAKYDGKSGRGAWVAASWKLLPAGVFVWVDEFEKDFYEDFSASTITLIGEREGDRCLTYAPLLEAGERATVLEGFDATPFACPNEDELPTFAAPARPADMPQALSALRPDARILVSEDFGGGSGTTSWRCGDYIAHLDRVMQRQAEGIFTVLEAAQVLADDRPGADARTMLDKMHRAYRDGDLFVRDLDDMLPLRPVDTYRDYFNVVTVADVDAWLDAAGARYQFPLPLRVVNGTRGGAPDDRGPALCTDDMCTASDAIGLTSVESPQKRCTRRLERFERLGGLMRRAGDVWHSNGGKRGVLAMLIREEKDAGRQMSDKTNVRKDLNAAMEDRMGS